MSCLNFKAHLFSFLSGHKNWVLYLAWSPDGKHLVSGSKSGELITWDPLTGKPSGSPLMVNNLTLFHIYLFVHLCYIFPSTIIAGLHLLM